MNLQRLKGKLTKKLILNAIILLILLYIAFVVLNWLGGYIQQDQIRGLIDKAGIFGPIIYGIYYLVSVIIAPFPLVAIFLVVADLYGIGKIIIYTYFLSIIGATVNFYIARFLGRPVVRKLIGKKGIERVDKVTNNFGIEALILTRLFSAVLYEYISFAAGLTNMKFRVYITITAIASMPYHILLYVVANSNQDLGKAYVTFLVIEYFTFLIPIVYFIAKSHIIEKILKRTR